ncbi:MAG: ABC transporter permease [Bacteroidaceae bacterium]|nr:ABC transporter permease [Bacteroidaceae bacterium]
MIDIFQEIIGTLKRNKLRTALTGFAVAWGIFMLIVLLGAGNGLMNAFELQSGNMSMNSMEIWPGQTSMPYKGLKEGRNIKLTEKELELTRDMKEHITHASAIISQGGVNVSNKQDHLSIQLTGVMPNYPETNGLQLKEGRFINQLDMQQKRKVIVIHEKTAQMLFDDDTSKAIGKYLSASGIPYLVVGIYTSMLEEFSPTAYLPYSTLQLIYNKGDAIGSIVFLTQGITDLAGSETFEQAYRTAIGKAKQFDAEDRSAIHVWNRFTQYLQQQTASDLLRTSIWVIGIFTLLSGIVGVSNIMLITVKERTREFGIRKALGAKPTSILWLIIAESITITTFFGYIGMVAGILATEYMNSISGEQVVDLGVGSATVFVDPTVDIHIAIQATLTLIIAGTLAGFFPARKAVMIRPIEALRG